MFVLHGFIPGKDHLQHPCCPRISARYLSQLRGDPVSVNHPGGQPVSIRSTRYCMLLIKHFDDLLSKVEQPSEQFLENGLTTSEDQSNWEDSPCWPVGPYCKYTSSREWPWTSHVKVFSWPIRQMARHPGWHFSVGLLQSLHTRPEDRPQGNQIANLVQRSHDVGWVESKVQNSTKSLWKSQIPIPTRYVFQLWSWEAPQFRSPSPAVIPRRQPWSLVSYTTFIAASEWMKTLAPRWAWTKMVAACHDGCANHPSSIIHDILKYIIMISNNTEK